MDYPEKQSNPRARAVHDGLPGELPLNSIEWIMK
jgi:hypothetical protein